MKIMYVGIFALLCAQVTASETTDNKIILSNGCRLMGGDNITVAGSTLVRTPELWGKLPKETLKGEQTQKALRQELYDSIPKAKTSGDL